MKEDRVTSENRDSTVDRLLMVIERFGVHVSRLASFIILDFFLATKSMASEAKTIPERSHSNDSFNTHFML